MDQGTFAFQVLSLAVVLYVSYLIMRGARKMKGKSLSQSFLYIGVALLVLFASQIVKLLDILPAYSWELWPYLEIASELLAVLIIYYAFRHLQKNTEAYDYLIKREIRERGVE